MQDDKNARYIEAIKFAAGGVQYRNLSVNKTFIDAIQQLYYYYENSHNAAYLEVATLYIRAYLEMGFSYEDGKEVFDNVLKELGTSRELEFPQKFYVAKRIKLNKSQVKSMIKKWPASPHQKMRIDEVVMDIITKVKNKEIGIFYYQCAVTRDMYELVISENEIFFHDLRRGIFYTFIVP
ncbi:hypothetical protein ADH76_01390 [Enterocloster clostridioformis]|nr:hypothetical protein A4V08_03025 [Lachnoclostridium sp. YL32]NDO27680.1 hypothetical protein [Enterocloster clostridioformis]OXE70144.1 hypothetical protein ADH76_01390 [Enterocloster clostridioformis]QQR00287.1 hypothetical protein I5Q83_31625 [Enterocloster clostridioformis]